ncbi:hypothetical protein Pmani_015997 [Petrolisthes manimaculis]|uniref:SURP motif domain-containing protein n=1 Tax=Petrolisthes manimaculis TaxID=1843537 RepID=A0AAE1U758_9EUCA|nr:hypothetical protein Pmani_015997 [Petrolisthes manimaculis]
MKVSKKEHNFDGREGLCDFLEKHCEISGSRDDRVPRQLLLNARGRTGRVWIPRTSLVATPFPKETPMAPDSSGPMSWALASPVTAPLPQISPVAIPQPSSVPVATPSPLASPATAPQPSASLVTILWPPSSPVANPQPPTSPEAMPQPSASQLPAFPVDAHLPPAAPVDEPFEPFPLTTSVSVPSATLLSTPLPQGRKHRVMASEFGRTVWEARDKDQHNTLDDLLVFGYSCKLFRDDEKALYVDKGKHLIPWMGDNNLMVDRFDVRGALYDLTEAESGDGVDRLEGLSEEERAEEELCEYERYLALYHDEVQVQAGQDEEAKRLLAELGSDTYAYSQVGYSYDGQVAGDPSVALAAAAGEQSEGQPQVEVSEQYSANEEEEEEDNSGYFPNSDEDVFIPPPELSVPQGMVVPKTVKQNKIIVKTSKFIVAQGGQMEIVIKTKQAGNPMFAFLCFDNSLNPYYKHMVTMIKNGRYHPTEELDQIRGEGGSSGRGAGGQYLHPSLSAGILPNLTPGTPTAAPAHKPSPDCSYSKLIFNIKEQQKNTAAAEGMTGVGDVSAPGSPAPATSTPAATPVPETPTPNSVSKKTKLKSNSTPVGSPKVGLVDYPSFNQTKDSEVDSDADMNGSGGDSDDDGEDCIETKEEETTEYSRIKWPPPDVQMVIDKMASYIIKNGAEFEAMVHSRDDPRFNFLKKDHEYYPYYRCKMRLYNEVYGDIFKDTAEASVSGNKNTPSISSKSTNKKDKQGNGNKGNGNSSNSSNCSNSSSSSSSNGNNNNSKQSSTISFSIKSREQDVNLDRHSTFPVESSSSDDEDMDEEEREKRREEREERRRKRKLKEKEERERREREEKERKEKEEKEKISEEKDDSTDGSGDNGGDDDMYDIFKYAQEIGHDNRAGEIEEASISNNNRYPDDDSPASSPLPAGTQRQPEKKQQERRKKAAMFLSRLKRGGAGGGSKEEEVPAQPVYGPQLPPEIAAQLLNSASQSPQSSLGSPRLLRPSSSPPSRSLSPPMPPNEAPAPPPPPPPLPPPHSPTPPLPPGTDEIDKNGSILMESNIIPRSSWASIPEPPPATTENERSSKLPSTLPPLPQDPTVLSGTSEDGQRSQSVENRRSKSRPVEISHREKPRSRKKQRHTRSESRSPSSGGGARKERKKRKRSRSRSRRHHKKRRSRSRSPKSHRSSHKKKRRKHSSRHERERGGRGSGEKKSKKSRRRSISSSSSSSSSTTGRSSSTSRSSTPSDNDVQVIDSPATSKRESRASSVVSVGPSDVSHLSTSFYKIGEDACPPSSPPPLPPIPENPTVAQKAEVLQEKTGNVDNLLEEVGDELKEEKKEEKRPLFDPQNSAAMAKIALGLRAKVHALLDKESKL